METVKKNKFVSVGIGIGLILGIVAFMSMAAMRTTNCGKSALKSCPATTQSCETACPCPAKKDGTCPKDCEKSFCETNNQAKSCPVVSEKKCPTAENAEENVKTCPVMVPESSCGKN